MKKLTVALVVCGLFALAANSFAAPNMIVNGDFSDALNGWTHSDNVSTTSFYDPFSSPSGDASPFALLLSDANYRDPFLRQTLDLPTGQLLLTVDFTLFTYEPTWGDDFRAQLEIGQLGQGWQQIYGYYSGDGIFSEYDGVNYPGLRYYSQYHFTYDLTAYAGTNDFILSFLVIDNNNVNTSGMLLDNVSITTGIPEPSTMILISLGLGMIGVPVIRRRRK